MNIRGSCSTRIADRFGMADIAAGKAAYRDLCGHEVKANGANVKESFLLGTSAFSRNGPCVVHHSVLPENYLKSCFSI